MSLPSRERGLKFLVFCAVSIGMEVAPLAGAWIEILSQALLHALLKRRSPRGSVD